MINPRYFSEFWGGHITTAPDVEGIESWKVNTDNPNKFLNVKGEAIESAAIIEAVEDAGFDIEWVSAD